MSEGDHYEAPQRSIRMCEKSAAEAGRVTHPHTLRCCGVVLAMQMVQEPQRHAACACAAASDNQRSSRNSFQSPELPAGQGNNAPTPEHSVEQLESQAVQQLTAAALLPVQVCTHPASSAAPSSQPASHGDETVGTACGVEKQAPPTPEGQLYALPTVAEPQQGPKGAQPPWPRLQLVPAVGQP